MRLAGQSKLGFYPTPSATLKLIPSWLSIVQEGTRRYLDPCCGTGEALATIERMRGPAETYGIELSDVRELEAKTRLTTTICCGYEYSQITDDTFSLVLLNPPYDGEGDTGGGARMEETFLLNTTSRITPRGILLYLIPHIRLHNEKIARHLAGWYSDLRCFKFAKEDYEVFDQIILFGVRRAEYKAPTAEAQNEILNIWSVGNLVDRYDEVVGEKGKAHRVAVPAPMPFFVAGQGEYAVPDAPLRGRHGAPFKFQYLIVSDEDKIRESERAAGRLIRGNAWRDLTPRLEPLVIEPAMEPKKGHIAMQVSGGLLGTNLLNDQGRVILLKGSVIKRSVTKKVVQPVDEEGAEPQPEEDDDKEHMNKVEMEERFYTSMAVLSEAGELTITEDVSEVKELLVKHVAQLADVVQARNQPRYSMNPKPWEWAIFDNLSRSRQLPGRNETGLTDFQKHLTVAMGRLCLADGAGFINAEMGSGKTTIGISIAEYLSAAKTRKNKAPVYPVLVVGPGIVTGKENWPKEIPEVIPGAKARVIEVGAKAAPRPMKIGQYLFSILGLHLNKSDFEGKNAYGCLNLLKRITSEQKLRVPKAIAKAVEFSLHEAEKRKPIRRRGATHPNLLDGRIGGFLWLGLDMPRDPATEDDRRYSVAQFLDEYASGVMPLKSFAILSHETAKLGPGRVPAIVERSILSSSDSIVVCACPICGTPLQDVDPKTEEKFYITPSNLEEWIGAKRRFCVAPMRSHNDKAHRAEIGKRIWDPDKGKHVVMVNDEHDQPHVCGSPLFSYTYYRREAAASYIAKKAKKKFGLMLMDEIHKAKAKGTGVGQTLTLLSNAIPYTVGLTGTLFGGYSTSIFWLLYRLAPEVRQEFGFNDEQRWVERYGLIKKVFYRDKELEEDGSFTGKKHFETVTERPGISPAIVGTGLKFCSFSSLTDIGLPLPKYSEEIARIAPSDDMKKQYLEADKGVYDWAISRMHEPGGKGAIGVWLTSALNRPSSMWRYEKVTFKARISGRGKWAIRAEEDVAEFESVVPPGGIVVVDGKEIYRPDLSVLLPKEDWLATTARNEMVQGRKTLVYVRQTGTRDIQPRLQAVLEARGLRVGILRPSLAPVKRATWIKQNAPKFDVLLTNARLVEVGLNLTMFATAIFYELEWSLYTLWQAMRRLYRPGAPLPVKLYFPVYTGTMEEKVIDLMGAKMMAAQAFYGDEVGGALVEDGDTGDLLEDLVRSAMGDLKIGRAEGLFSLGNDLLVTESPMGSPTAVSPRMKTMSEMLALVQTSVSHRKKVVVPDTQFSMF